MLLLHPRYIDPIYRWYTSTDARGHIVLELPILGLLLEEPLHGYELKKRLDDTLGAVAGASYGSLYPALARLERAGAIEAVEPAPGPGAAIPATGSIGGETAAARVRRRLTPSRRRRKEYRITERGRALLRELLAAETVPGSDDDRAFALKLAFCRYLEPEARLELLERRRARLSERLARIRRALGTRPHGQGDPYTRSLIEHGTEATRRDLEWVDELIAAEQRASTSGRRAAARAQPRTAPPKTAEPRTAEPRTRSTP